MPEAEDGLSERSRAAGGINGSSELTVGGEERSELLLWVALSQDAHKGARPWPAKPAERARAVRGEGTLLGGRWPTKGGDPVREHSAWWMPGQRRVGALPWGARQGGEAQPRWAVEDVGFEVGGSARLGAGLWAAELRCRLECNRMRLRPRGVRLPRAGCWRLGS